MRVGDPLGGVSPNSSVWAGRIGGGQKLVRTKQYYYNGMTAVGIATHSPTDLRGADHVLVERLKYRNGSQLEIL
jgi:hypothetical protein